MKLQEIKEAIKFNCGCEYCEKTKMVIHFQQTLNAIKEEIQSKIEEQLHNCEKNEYSERAKAIEVLNEVLEMLESARGEQNAI